MTQPAPVARSAGAAGSRTVARQSPVLGDQTERRLAAGSSGGEKATLGNHELFVVNANGTGLKELTSTVGGYMRNVFGLILSSATVVVGVVFGIAECVDNWFEKRRYARERFKESDVGGIKEENW